MTIIKKIEAKETYSVRLPVLRKGKPIESCYFEGDDLETTHHFGLYLIQELLGIVSLFQKNNPYFNKKNNAKFAEWPFGKSEKKDFGKALIIHCEEEFRIQGIVLIWFNARMGAAGFY